MAKFLSGNNLNASIENIFREPTDKLVLISPFIKLHDRYKACLRNHLNDDKRQVIVVFGKNEDNISKSMSAEDLNFFKEFPNVEIRYEKRLHAKYYSNGLSSIVTSMNLYSYSQDNNIEVGVLMEFKLLGSNSLDADTEKYFDEVIRDAELIYKKSPTYESGMFKKTYKGSTVDTDITGNIFGTQKQTDQIGYCIRTGVKIPFNQEKPLSAEAYKSWSKYGDSSYPEKFCHFSGESSHGETSVAKPFLRKNWSKAKELIK